MKFYTIEDLKRTVVGDFVASRTVFNLQRSGIGNVLPLRCTKHPVGVRF